MFLLQGGGVIVLVDFPSEALPSLRSRKEGVMGRSRGRERKSGNLDCDIINNNNNNNSNNLDHIC